MLGANPSEGMHRSTARGGKDLLAHCALLVPWHHMVVAGRFDFVEAETEARHDRGGRPHGAGLLDGGLMADVGGTEFVTEGVHPLMIVAGVGEAIVHPKKSMRQLDPHRL